MGKFIDLTGKHFGRLQVLERSEDKIQPNGKHIVMWKCQCQCKDKNIVYVPAYRLNSGITKSCGCIRKETASLLSKKYNKYDLSGEYGIGWTSNTNEEFYFDLEDYEKIKDYCWHKNHNGYLTYIKNNGHYYDKNLNLSRIIMDCPDDLVVDHINHNTLDNRKSNLRLATVSQNGMNHKICSENKSGYSGVWLDTKNNRWCASIMCNQKNVWLGSFKNINDAVSARFLAEEQYFGEFSYKNSMQIY